MLFLVSHCCCEPLTMLPPSNCESAIKAATRKRRASAVIHQGSGPIDQNATHRRGLRHCPEFAGVAAEGRVGYVDGQVRQRSPEVQQRDAVAASALVVYVDRTIDHHVARRLPESSHAGVVANLKIEGRRARSIRAGLEQQRVALSSELVGKLLFRYRVYRCLDLAERHAGIEYVNVWTKIRLSGLGLFRRCCRTRERRHRKTRQHKSSDRHNSAYTQPRISNSKETSSNQTPDPISMRHRISP